MVVSWRGDARKVQVVVLNTILQNWVGKAAPGSLARKTMLKVGASHLDDGGHFGGNLGHSRHVKVSILQLSSDWACFS